MLDAAAASVPIITTTALAVESIFSPSEAVLLPAGNPLALAHALVDLVANPAAAARRAAHARAHVLTHHAASDLIAESVLKPLNAKLGQACFTPAGAAGQDVNVAFAAACAAESVRAKLDTSPPAGLLSGPEARNRALRKAV